MHRAIYCVLIGSNVPDCIITSHTFTLSDLKASFVGSADTKFGFFSNFKQLPLTSDCSLSEALLL